MAASSTKRSEHSTYVAGRLRDVFVRRGGRAGSSILARVGKRKAGYFDRGASDLAAGKQMRARVRLDGALKSQVRCCSLFRFGVGSRGRGRGRGRKIEPIRALYGGAACATPSRYALATPLWRASSCCRCRYLACKQVRVVVKSSNLPRIPDRPKSKPTARHHHGLAVAGGPKTRVKRKGRVDVYIYIYT